MHTGNARSRLEFLVEWQRLAEQQPPCNRRATMSNRRAPRNHRATTVQPPCNHVQPPCNHVQPPCNHMSVTTKRFDHPAARSIPLHAAPQRTTRAIPQGAPHPSAYFPLIYARPFAKKDALCAANRRLCKFARRQQQLSTAGPQARSQAPPQGGAGGPQARSQGPPQAGTVGPWQYIIKWHQSNLCTETKPPKFGSRATLRRRMQGVAP